MALVGVVLSPAAGASLTVPDAWIPLESRPVLIPEPQSLRWLDGVFALTEQSRIVVGDAAAPEDLFAARDLNEEIRSRTGRALPVVRAGTVSEASDVIVLGEPSLNRLAEAVLTRESLRLPDDGRSEGYVLKVTPGFVVASGVDRRGTYYAAQTLRQLLVPSGTGFAFQGAEVRDWPDHKVRAVHILLDNSSDPFHVALIDRVFSKFKFNTVVMEAEYVRWESARNLWHPGGATKEQVARVIQAARDHHMDVIPLIQTLGHVDWLYHNNQNLDLLEIPPAESNARFVYNPLNPRVYDVILPVIDEAVRLFRPPYVHIGHDEVRNVVPFPWSDEGKRTGFAQLFLRDTMRYYEFLKARQVGTMMWADVLLTNDFAPEIAHLPRDILMVDWQYQEASRYPSLRRYVQWGFPTIGATWWKPGNIIGFAQEGQRQGALGMMRTTWTGHFGNRTVLDRQYQQIYTYLTAAEHFWKPRRTTPPAYDLAARFREEWEGPSRRTAGVPGRLVDLRPAATRSQVDETGKGWIGKGAEYDLRRVPTGRRRFGRILFEVLDPRTNRGRSIVMLQGRRQELRGLPRRVRVPVDAKAAVIAFLHTTPFPGGQFGEQVGTYMVRYEDGTQETIALLYKRNIGSWLDDPISISHEIVWVGQTVSGLQAGLSMLRWVNPHPDKEIAFIEFASKGTDAAPAVFAVTLLSEKP